MSKKTEPRGYFEKKWKQLWEIFSNEQKEIVARYCFASYTTLQNKKDTIEKDIKDLKKDIIELAQGLKQLDDWCRTLEIKLTELEVK